MEDDLTNILDEFEQSQQKLPNAQAAFILGILSIFPGCFCCIGFILGIIGLILGNTAVKEYEANPERYYESDYKSAKNGKTLSIVGLALTVIGIILQIVLNLGTAILDNSF
ncbi:MAG: hypothetical protein ACI94Y_004313 [Maribacter sp.]|jgi:hypothetical protein